MSDRSPSGFTAYGNRAGDSGVLAYAIGADWIDVVFADRAAIYRYGYSKPGRAHVTRMIALARQGRGLATYINQHVRADYQSRRPPGPTVSGIRAQS